MKLGFEFLDLGFLRLDGLGLHSVHLNKRLVLVSQPLNLVNQIAVSSSQVVELLDEILEVREKCLVKQSAD